MPRCAALGGPASATPAVPCDLSCFPLCSQKTSLQPRHHAGPSCTFCLAHHAPVQGGSRLPCPGAANRTPAPAGRHARVCGNACEKEEGCIRGYGGRAMRRRSARQRPSCLLPSCAMQPLAHPGPGHPPCQPASRRAPLSTSGQTSAWRSGRSHSLGCARAPALLPPPYGLCLMQTPSFHGPNPRPCSPNPPPPPHPTPPVPPQPEGEDRDLPSTGRESSYGKGSLSPAFTRRRSVGRHRPAGCTTCRDRA